MENIKEIIEIDVNGNKGRLDKVLSYLMNDFSRAGIQKLIKAGHVIVDTHPEKANYKLNGSEKIIINIPYEEEQELIAEDIPLDIVYEDDELLVVNKPVNMVVHPSKGHSSGTLVNALLYYLGSNLSAGSEAIRPGIVHRIDKDTSGLIVVAKNNYIHHKLSAQLSSRKMGRKYIALVNGVVEPSSGTIEVPLARDPHNRLRFVANKDGKEAITSFSVIERYQEGTMVEAELRTGRTHQIRAHFEYIGHPIVGDPVYRNGLAQIKGQTAKLHDGQYLHAQSIEFEHPRTLETMSFTTKLPERFELLLRTMTPFNA